MQEAKMVVQTGPRLKRGFERRIERGQVLLRGGGGFTGVCGGRLGGGIRRRRGYVGRGGYDVRIRIKMRGFRQLIERRYAMR
jgi:hypothetical protein